MYYSCWSSKTRLPLSGSTLTRIPPPWDFFPSSMCNESGFSRRLWTAFQRPGTVYRIKTFFRQQRFSFPCNFQGETEFRQALFKQLSWISTILTISSLPRLLNMTTSSTRFKNCGRKFDLSSSITRASSSVRFLILNFPEQVASQV